MAAKINSVAFLASTKPLGTALGARMRYLRKGKDNSMHRERVNRKSDRLSKRKEQVKRKVPHPL